MEDFLKKSTFCRQEVTWFGRTFSATGVSADPKKINAIIEAGRPKSTDEVLSLIQAAAYNARFMFDHGEARPPPMRRPPPPSGSC